MFASRRTKEIETPTKPSYTVTIKALSGRAKERSQQAVLGKAAQLVETVGGAKIFAALQQLGGEDAVREEARETNPTAAFDRDQVLVDGIVKWSAPEELNAETIGDLEEDVSELLFVEILRLSKIPTSSSEVDADKERRKNV